MPAEPTIELVIWDVGNVLVRWDLRALYRRLFDDEAEMERFLAEVWTEERNLRCDRGEPYASVIAEAVAEHPHHETAIRAAWERWIETIPGEVPGSLDLLRATKVAGCRAWGLSNFSLETFPLIADRYPHLGELEGVVLSGEVQVTKPDPRIYEIVLDRAGVERQRAVFLDDSPTNVSGALAVGLDAIRFVDAEQAREELRARGVAI